ncbi:MAG: hypothetical protein ACI8X5_000249 [Planctomycetota bacterium]|jgi:hypothetical protein
MNHSLRALCPLLLFLGLCAPVNAAQIQQQPQTVPAPPAFEQIDGVALVINGDAITDGAIDRAVDRARAKQTLSTQEEYIALYREVRAQMIESNLMRQAGEDMGLPPEVIRSHVSGMLEDQQEKSGGAFEMAKKLREEDTTAAEIRESLESKTVTDEWRRKVIGYAGPGARTAEDRFIRPGTLGQHYRHIQRTGKDMKPLVSLGARPATYDLQILLIDAQKFGGLAKAQEVAIDVWSSASEGEEDWDDLVEEFGAIENQGMVPGLDIEIIQRALDPGDGSMLQFVMEGPLDRISKVMPYLRLNQATGQRQQVGFAIYRLLSREIALLPEYDREGVQRQLRRFLDGIGDEQRMQLALDKLQRTAYIWHRGLAQQEANLELKEQQRDDAIEAAREQNAEKIKEAAMEPEASPAAPEKPGE